MLGVYANAQTVSNVSSTFSCPGEMTIIYDLNTTTATNVTVSYSTDNGQIYHPCTTVTGDLNNQSSGKGKNVIWNLKADGFSTGFFVFKVEAVKSCNGAMINGVCWATRNVGEPGKFVGNPEDAGMFYQWNRNIGWSATDPMINSNNSTTWDKSVSTGATWEKANDPCPAGWRVPTLDEIQKLLDTNEVSHEWTTENSINGKRFTDKATSNSIFLPAVGDRYKDAGTLNHVGSVGYYWNSTLYKNYVACYLFFDRYEVKVYTNGDVAYGLSCRCVAE